MEDNIAIVDLGSNTIKITVITRSLPLTSLYRSTKNIRISRGMHKENVDALSDNIMREAATAVQDLIAEVAQYKPKEICIVGTSALRDAKNTNKFSALLEQTVGIQLRVLSGEEEAQYTGKGALMDPILSDVQEDFCVVDLGGGSLECIDFQHGKMKQSVSLPLGAVRLTEQFIKKPEEVINYSVIEDIFEFAQQKIKESEFDFTSVRLPVIGVGGAFVALRSITTAQQKLEDSQIMLNCRDLAEILQTITNQTIKDRLTVPGLPAKRADILPAAIAVILAVADLAKCKYYMHTYYNLPFGIVAEMIEKSADN